MAQTGARRSSNKRQGKRQKIPPLADGGIDVRDSQILDEILADLRSACVRGCTDNDGRFPGGQQAALEAVIAGCRWFLSQYSSSLGLGFEVEGRNYRRLSAAEYALAIKHRVIHEGEATELLDGMLVEMMSKNRPHSIATKKTRDELTAIVPKGWYVDSQEPISIPELRSGAGNLPEPDVMVIRGATTDYPDHPPSDKVGLVVEVSDSTLQFDRTKKKRLYAHGRVPEFWIVNVLDRQLEVFQRPTGTGDKADYDVQKVIGLNDSVSIRLGNQSAGSISARSFFPET